MPTQSIQAKAEPLHTIAKCIMVCLSTNVVGVIWGGVGIGKSSLVKQIADQIGYKLYDFRASDKEPSDIGGIPYPVEDKKGHKFVEWLIASGRIPFITEDRKDEKAILFLDEIDRCDHAVQNVLLQLLLDREVNGHKLCPSVRILAAGNGSSDIATTPLSDAAATRMAHFYVDQSGPEAVTSWQKWADANNVEPTMKGFANFRPVIFMGEAQAYVELQKPTPRTFCMGLKLVENAEKLEWGHEILTPLLSGAVGQAAAMEYLAYKSTFERCPTPEQILKDPKGAKVPEFQFCFPLGQVLINHALRSKSRAEQEKVTSAFITYVNRWSDEQKAHWFRTASKALPEVVKSPEYREWERTFRV